MGGIARIFTSIFKPIARAIGGKKKKGIEEKAKSARTLLGS